MMLHALAGYYRRMVEEGGATVAPEGFERKEIPFVLVLEKDGRFIDLLDTREGAGKKKQSRVFTVPKGVKKTSGVAANLLWDTPNYVLGIPKPDPAKDPQALLEKAREQRQAFVRKIQDAFPAPVTDEGIAAVLQFCAGGIEALRSHPSWNELVESGANLTFQLAGDTGLICQRPAVVSALTATKGDAGQADMMVTCLVSGEADVPVRLHTAIKGVRGAQSVGANIVSFNLSAFNSFAKVQGLNAPVGAKAEFAYTTALNHLLRKESRQKLLVGETTAVFWTGKDDTFESLFADFFSEPVKENPEQQYVAIRALYAAPQTGAPPLEQDYERFYVLGLAPNAARLAIRFWYQGTVGETARRVRQHFDDCAIVHGPKQPEYLSLYRLLCATALQGKADNVPPNLAGEVMQAILDGTPYPQTLLAAAIRRCRAEREVTYPRAALLKAVLTRYRQTTEKEIMMALDPDNMNIGYRLGRLFAVLEKTQEEASPGINATIRDRYYGAASGTPVAVFSQLMRLKNHHLAKLDNRGRAVNLERMIGEIMNGIDDFPAHLTLPDQGRFAVGYYHQRQSFFTKTNGAQANQLQEAQQ